MSGWGVQAGSEPDSPTLSEKIRNEQELEDEMFGHQDEEMQEITYTDDDANGIEDFEKAMETAQSQAEAREQREGPATGASDGTDGWIRRGDPRRGGASSSRVVHDDSDDDDSDDQQARGAQAAQQPQQPRQPPNPQQQQRQHPGVFTSAGPPRSADASCMSDFRAAHLGANVTPKLPQWSMASGGSIWQPFEAVMRHVGSLRCVRAEAYQISAEVIPSYATRFRQWCTPAQNPMRAAQLAALLGMVMTPASKGFMSGNHEEMQRANGEADEDIEKEDSKKGPRRVFRYAFMHPEDNNISVPMFTYALQEIYNDDLTQVVAIRVWKYVWDAKHSSSELWRKLMDENQSTFYSAGLAHNQTDSRRKNSVAEQKQNRIVTGGMSGRGNLEYYAGTQYTRILNETNMLDMLRHYGGASMRGSGRPVFKYNELPDGLLATRLHRATNDLGGTHVLSPEYWANAQREMALRAGMVSFADNTDIEAHPDYFDPKNFFHPNGDIRQSACDQKTGGFFFCVDPSVTNLFDVALPRSIHTNITAGPSLLKMFEERERDVNNEVPTYATAADRFNNMMTDKDPAHLEMERQMAETVITFDSMDLSDQERKSLRCYGETDVSNNYIIEPRQPLKEIQQQTRRVHAMVIEEWLQKSEKAIAELNEKIRMKNGPDDEMVDVDFSHKDLQEVNELKEKAQQRHADVVRDLVYLHISRIESAFQSKLERETIPAGYLAMFDGLNAELAKTPNNTASVAFAHDSELIADDVSVYAHIHLWLGTFFEHDCFVEGRDRRIMDEIFLTMFEQYGDVTFLVLLCGYKGNGKSLRTERAMEVFPPNWATAGGPSSAKAGMNGQSDSTNGKNIIYDEMIDDLCDPDGSDRLEYWKQIVLKREYTYQRTVPVKNPDGTDSHRTMKLRTPHDETHLICTNYGMAFTKDKDPSDTKFAMIDRSIAHLVRSIGKNAHTDGEFKEHMSKPEQQRKLAKFRMFVCLVGATKLCIKGVPSFQPNFAYANKFFDYLDNNMVVGEYNLPARSARKSLKREENLRTMCCMVAVAKVFMYKQTAVEFEAGRLGEDGLPQQFRWTMLYDVIRQLYASPELVFIAWSQSLDYNIGTAAHSFAAMTAICESFGIRVGHWMKKPPTANPSEYSNSSGALSPSLLDNNPYPVRDDSMDDAAWQRAVEQWQYQAGITKNDNRFNEYDDLLTAQGLTRQERLDMLEGMARRRRITSHYRHQCTLDGNSELVMTSPIENVIERIMSKQERPPDLQEQAAGGSQDVCMPLYSSCVFADAVQLGILHRPQAIVHWCSGRNATIDEVGPCVALGTAPGYNFAKSLHRGTCGWDSAWLTRPETNGWLGFARGLMGRNHTCRIFDLPLNGMRDLCYLMSTRDAARRITSTPYLPPSMQNTFVNQNDEPVTSGTYFIKMRGIKDTRDNTTFEHGKEGAPRHPYSKVPNVALQRSLDFAMSHGRFPAMLPVISNKVTTEPPVRIVYEGSNSKEVQLNTASALEHTRMIAEAVLRCSVQPGMEDEQERFCDDIQGPPGLAVPIDPASPPGSGMSTKLPYSYDIMSIALTLDAMSRFYDPVGRSYCDYYRSMYGASLGLDVTFEKLPHMSLRFVGFPEKNRLLLSHKIPETRNPVFGAIEVADENLETELCTTTCALVSLSLSHDASDDEISRHMKARAGSRAMSGVTGDLLSMQTWVTHTCTALTERGMVSGVEDVVVAMVQDEPYGVRQRVVELASVAINRVVDGDQRMKDAEKEQPGDKDLPPERLLVVKEQRMRKVRNDLYKTIKLPEHLEDLRDCGPLRIKPKRHKLTYANSGALPVNENAGQGSKRKAPAVTSATQYGAFAFKNMAALPGKKKKPVAEGVRGRGVQDSRMRF